MVSCVVDCSVPRRRAGIHGMSLNDENESGPIEREAVPAESAAEPEAQYETAYEAPYEAQPAAEPAAEAREEPRSRWSLRMARPTPRQLLTFFARGWALVLALATVGGVIVLLGLTVRSQARRQAVPTKRDTGTKTPA